MTNNLAAKMAAAVRWNEKDLQSVLSQAEMAVNALGRKKIPLEGFFEAAAEEGPYPALLLLVRLERAGRLLPGAAAADRQQIRERCGERMRQLEETLSAECADDADGQNADAALTEIRQTAACAIILSDASLLKRCLQQAEGLLRDKPQVVAFSAEMFAMLRHAPNEVACYARLYRAFYEQFPMDWASEIAYNQGVEIPVHGEAPQELIDLIRTAVRDGQLRYADQVLKVFVSVSLSQLRITKEELMERIFLTDDEDRNLYRGLLFAEKMILFDAPTKIEGELEWWDLVNRFARSENSLWQECREWFRMYHLCRKLAFCPERAGEFLKGAELPAYDYAVKKTNGIQQAAFEALFLAKEKHVLEFLDVLGEHNIYRFRTDEAEYPYYQKHLTYDCNAATRHLKELGYSTEELIQIYMNTHLRSCYNLSDFLRVVFAGGEGVKKTGTIGHIEEYFAPYRMLADVGMRDERYGLFLHNVNLGGRRLALLPSNLQQDQRFLEKFEAEKGPVYCHIAQVGLSNFSVRAVPDDQEWAQNQQKESFEQFRLACARIIESEELTTEENHRISALRFPRERSAEEKLELGLLSVRCCSVLAKTPGAARYFIIMINRMEDGQLNPYRYQLSRKQERWVHLSREDLAEVLACWDRIHTHGLPLEEMFFIYINTLFRYCIPFSGLMERYYGREKKIVNLASLLSEKTAYWFTGKVLSVTPDRNAGSGMCYVSVDPELFYRGAKGKEDRFTLRTDEDMNAYIVGLPCSFRISGYNCYNRTFFIEKITRKNDLRQTQPKALFKTVMNQMAITADLSARDKADLEVDLHNWSGRDTAEVILPVTTALERRAGDIRQLNEYLDLIAKNNPWRFDRELLRDCADWQVLLRGYQMELRLTRLFRQIVTQTAMAPSILRIYFNTVIRSFVSLNKALSICEEQGIDLDEIGIWMKDYPLHLRRERGVLWPVNFIGERIMETEMLSEKDRKAQEGAVMVWRLKAYEQETNTLVVSLDDR